MQTDDIIRDVLRLASLELEKLKQTKKRKSKIEIIEVDDSEDEEEIENEVESKPVEPEIVYTAVRDNTWFNIFINRRENKKNLMVSKQGSTYLAFDRNCKLVLTYNVDTSEITSSFDISTFLGPQVAKM